jgi:hypothetical protein
MADPTISFVVVARNDNYGGDFLHRINVFVNNLLPLCERLHMPSELLIVEWNPPPDRPRLAEAITWPTLGQRYSEIRIVEVPETVHTKLPRADQFPVFEYIGKNVGVRRARGEYVLVTNPDVLFSAGLLRAIYTEALSPERYYRTARYDVMSPVPAANPEEQLAYCRQHILRSLGYVYSANWGCWSRWNPYRRAKALARYCKSAWQHQRWVVPFTNAAGDFFLMHRDGWRELQGFPEMKSHSHHDSYLTYCAHASGRRLRVFRGSDVYLYHQDHGREEHANRPATSQVECVRHGLEMTRKRQAMTFNDSNWGLGTEALPERTPGEYAGANRESAQQKPGGQLPQLHVGPDAPDHWQRQPRHTSVRP